MLYIYVGVYACVYACTGMYICLGDVVYKEPRFRIQRPFAPWVAPQGLSFLSYKIRVEAQLCSPDSGGLTEGKAGRGLVNFNVGHVNPDMNARLWYLLPVCA